MSEWCQVFYFKFIFVFSRHLTIDENVYRILSLLKWTNIAADYEWYSNKSELLQIQYHPLISKFFGVTDTKTEYGICEI